MKLTDTQKHQIDFFLFRNHPHTYNREQYERAYRNWFRGGRTWDCLSQGGTGQMRLIMWYQNHYKPNSKEWRPTIIINAVLDYLKNEKSPIKTVV